MSTARVAIDLNIRVRGNETYAGFEDIDGYVVVGSPVEVWEPESGTRGSAIVTAVDGEKRLIYLAVEWASLGTDRPNARSGNVALCGTPAVLKDLPAWFAPASVPA